MIFAPITRASMASLAMFFTVVKLRKSATDVFAQKLSNFGKALEVFAKKFSKDIFPRNLLSIPLISNWTSCRSIEGVIVLVISNQPHASRSSILKLLAPLLPELYSTRSNYYYKFYKDVYYP